MHARERLSTFSDGPVGIRRSTVDARDRLDGQLAVDGFEIGEILPIPRPPQTVAFKPAQ
jgi:hypothetical protein